MAESWYRRRFGDATTYVVAPMVDQSEHSFRVLTKRHGATLAYTPMFSARQFAESELYRRTIFGPTEGSVEADDRPLVIQFAGHDPDVLLSAAKHVQHRCDAVDVNFGCPQKIAKRGRYGAWLLHEPQLMARLVGTLHCHLDCPVTAKIRLSQEEGFKSKRSCVASTVDQARMLVGAGASVIAVHGRTREQKGHEQGSADWEAIAAVKAAVSVPVFANGGVRTWAEVQACLAATRADGCMAAEGLLSDPALFEPPAEGAAGRGARQQALALEYIELQACHPADLKSVKQHFFSMLYAGLQVHTDLRESMHKARTLEQMRECVEELTARPPAARSPFCDEPGPRYTCWYRRHAWEEQRTALKAAHKAAEAQREQPEPGPAIDAGGEDTVEVCERGAGAGRAEC